MLRVCYVWTHNDHKGFFFFLFFWVKIIVRNVSLQLTCPVEWWFMLSWDAFGPSHAVLISAGRREGKGEGRSCGARLLHCWVYSCHATMKLGCCCCVCLWCKSKYVITLEMLFVFPVSFHHICYLFSSLSSCHFHFPFHISLSLTFLFSYWHSYLCFNHPPRLISCYCYLE